MMLTRFNQKCFILILLGMFVLLDTNKFILSVKIKLSKNDNNLEDKITNSVDINKTNSASLASLTNEEELVKSISSIGVEEIGKLDIEGLKTYTEDKDINLESCENIKKIGRQKNYCENKYLLSEGEERIVECMKSFCSICCDNDESCENKCSITHSLFREHDPEDMFMSVCSYKEMGPSFEGFCKSMLTENDGSEYNQCLNNFCFDCCSNELKVNDSDDPEMIKCLSICTPNKDNIRISLPVPGTKEADIQDEGNKKIKRDKLNSKDLVEIKNTEDTIEFEGNKIMNIKKNFDMMKFKSISNSNDDKNKNEEGFKNKNEEHNILNDFTLKNKNINKKQNIGKKGQDYIVQNELVDKTDSTRLFYKTYNNTLNIDSNKRPNLDSISSVNKSKNKDQMEESKLELLPSVANLKFKTESRNLQKKFESALKEANLDNILTKGNKLMNTYSASEIISEEKKQQNIKICENFILSVSNIKFFSKSINNHCNSNYKTNSFNSSNDCLNNLCSECCNFLEGKKEIDQCILQCREENSVSTNKINVKATENINSSNINLIPKINKFPKNNNLLNNQLDENLIFPNFITKSETVSFNFMYFNLIKSICNTKYFKNCHETICADYCNDTANLINTECMSKCTEHMNNPKQHSDSFDYILKHHGYYEAIQENMYTGKNKIEEFEEDKLILKEDRILDSGLNNNIDKSKNKIEILKKELMKEENNLLNLYKSKNK